MKMCDAAVASSGILRSIIALSPWKGYLKLGSNKGKGSEASGVGIIKRRRRPRGEIIS